MCCIQCRLLLCDRTSTLCTDNTVILVPTYSWWLHHVCVPIYTAVQIIPNICNVYRMCSNFSVSLRGLYCFQFLCPLNQECISFFLCGSPGSDRTGTPPYSIRCLHAGIGTMPLQHINSVHSFIYKLKIEYLE